MVEQRSPRFNELKTKCDLVVRTPGPGYHGFLSSLGDLYLRELQKLKGLPKETSYEQYVKQLENVIALSLAVDAFGPDQDASGVHYDCGKPLP